MILVTGGSGFLGKYVCEEFIRAGKEVLDFSLQISPDDRYPGLAGDIADRDALSAVFEQYPIESVVHLASLLHTESRLNPERAFRVNVVGSANLIECCLQKGIKRFVFGSTIDMIGYYPRSKGPIDESAEVLPNDLYGETKRFIEKLGISFAELEDFEFVSARIPLIVGPGEPTPTSAWRMDMFNRLGDSGVLELPFAPDEWMAVSHVQDSAQATALLALAQKPKHIIYNLPCETWPLSNLGKTIERHSTGLQVRFGNKRFDFCPALVNWQRFAAEFGYTPTSLAQHLEMYKRRFTHVR